MSSSPLILQILVKRLKVSKMILKRILQEKRQAEDSRWLKTILDQNLKNKEYKRYASFLSKNEVSSHPS
jgi:hypothetical protein